MSLPSNWSTGYSWTIKESAELEIWGNYYPDDSSDNVGTGGKEVYTVFCNEPGKFDIVFEYERIFEPAVKKTTLHLTVL